jgi:hypothetical protein
MTLFQIVVRKVEDNKGVVRQDNAMSKKTNNCSQTLDVKVNIRQHEPHRKIGRKGVGSELGSSGRVNSSFSTSGAYRITSV